MPSGPEWIIVLVVVLVIFGGSQLPKLARNLGKAQKEFKDGLSEGEKEAAAQKAAEVEPPAPPASPHRDPHRHAEHRRSHERLARACQLGGDLQATPLEDAPALPFAAPTPHAVVDAVLEGVFEALGRHRAAGADLPSLLDAHSVARERTSPVDTAGSCPLPSTLWRCRLPTPLGPCPSLLFPCSSRTPPVLSLRPTPAVLARFPILVRRRQDPAESSLSFTQL